MLFGAWRLELRAQLSHRLRSHTDSYTNCHQLSPTSAQRVDLFPCKFSIFFFIDATLSLPNSRRWAGEVVATATAIDLHIRATTSPHFIAATFESKSA